MALKDITNTIKAEAEAEAEKIKAEGNKQVESVTQKGKEKVAAEKKLLDERTNKEVQKVLDKAKFHANIEERNEIVAAKQKIVVQVFKESLPKIGGLDDNVYVDFIGKLINVLPSVKDGQIVSAAGKEELTKKALEKSEREFSVLAETVESVGGFVFRSEDIEVNDTFEALLVGLKDDLEIKVSEILFGENK